MERAGRCECLPNVRDLHYDPVIGEARLVPGDELGAREGHDYRVPVDYADRRDSLVPEQLADEKAVAAAEHEQARRPSEPPRAASRAGWASRSWWITSSSVSNCRSPPRKSRSLPGRVRGPT